MGEKGFDAALDHTGRAELCAAVGLHAGTPGCLLHLQMGQPAQHHASEMCQGSTKGIKICAEEKRQKIHLSVRLCVQAFKMLTGRVQLFSLGIAESSLFSRASCEDRGGR